MLVILGLVAAFVLIALFSDPRRRQCRWREYPGEAESEWVCVQCGARQTGPKGRAPRTCFRPSL